MNLKLNPITIGLTILFMAGYVAAGAGAIDWGQYTRFFLILGYFILLTYYDQSQRPHMERNYIFIFTLLAVLVGVVGGGLLFGERGVVLGGGVLGAGVMLALIALRKPFYRKLDQMMGVDPEE